MFGHWVDELYILMSNVCPPALKIIISMTESGPCLDSDWSDSVHDLLLDSAWTELGQALDNDWILRPVYVQPSIGFQYPKNNRQD